MPHISQGHGDSLDWYKSGGVWFAKFYCPKHRHSVTLNGFTATAGPGETAELSEINNDKNHNDIRHNCF